MGRINDGGNEGWIGQAPAEPLETYCARLNAMAHTQASGTEWFVNERRRENGETERYLDRRDIGLRRAYWRPTQAEMRATEAVIAHYARSDITQYEFNQLVQRGVISREVDAMLRETADA